MRLLGSTPLRYCRRLRETDNGRVAGRYRKPDAASLHLASTRTEAEHIDFDAQLVARRDRTAELGSVDSGEDG